MKLKDLLPAIDCKTVYLYCQSDSKFISNARYAPVAYLDKEVIDIYSQTGDSVYITVK